MDDTYRVAVSDIFPDNDDPYASLIYFTFPDREQAIMFVHLCLDNGKYATIFSVNEGPNE